VIPSQRCDDKTNAKDGIRLGIRNPSGTKVAKVEGWSPMEFPVKWYFSKYKFDMKRCFKKTPSACFQCNFLKCFACAFDRFHATAERFPMNCLRVFRPFFLKRGFRWIFIDSFVTLAQWIRVRHLTEMWVIRRFPIRFWPKPRDLKSKWISANRPSSKGSKLFFPVIKANKITNSDGPKVDLDLRAIRMLHYCQNTKLF